MSVDTRTHRPPAGGTPRGFFEDEQSVLSTVKVPCDPAQVIVNHASFRVELPTSAPPGRRRPVVLSGAGAAGAAGMSSLLATATATAVRERPRPRVAEPDGLATQVLPRLDPSVLGAVPVPRRGADETQLLPPIKEPPAFGAGAAGDGGRDGQPDGSPVTVGRAQDARQAYKPDRRLDLGVVLLPLRFLLGFLAISAGMGKITDPVYFDGGERGSMVTWLSSLEPWAVAAPLHSWALNHPVAAGLTVAFTQIVVGVLTIFGLWQRCAAAIGAALSLALLVTVAWRSGPVYDTPDLILLAAWSPLIIAGAPVYSLDARLAGEAWRTLGPRAPLSELRRRVLRRGAIMATVLIGLALLIGAVLGGAVRSSQIARLPEPGEPPRNHLPGQPLENAEEAEEAGEETAGATEPSAGAGGAEDPAGEAGEDAATPEESTEEEREAAEEEQPRSEQTVPAPQQPAAPPAAPPSQSSTPEQVPSPGGDGGEPSAESDGGPADEGGDGNRSSLDPIGGLLG
ncbi:DoxX family membrane protein [Streptomyces carpaticus]|uniref:DoxX family membrane protein n=2 Tax=Streptomyces TaxID=1883 RepID=A0ABV4ZKP3_9ACTN